MPKVILQALQETLNTIENAELDQWRLLLGWAYTSSNFPDHCWRWTKLVNDVTLAVSQSDAICFELRDFEPQANNGN